MKLLPDNPLGRFVLRVVAWLPFTFFMWYFMATAITWPLTLLVEWVSTTLFPLAIASVDQPGHVLNVVTRFAMRTPAGDMALMTFDIDPLSYGYGMPLLTALIIATPGDEAQKWRRWGLGLLLLLLTQAWGVCFDIFTHLAMTMGDAVSQRMGFTDLQLEGIALGYQFGYLMLPPLAPVVIWILMHRDFIATLAQRPVENPERLLENR